MVDFRHPAHILTMRLGVTVAFTMEKLSIVIAPPPASATERYGCSLNPRPPAHAPSTSWEEMIQKTAVASQSQLRSQASKTVLMGE